MGGVERVTIELANALQERGHKLSLIDFSGENIFYYKTNEYIEKPKAVKRRSVSRKVIGRLLKLINRIGNKSDNVFTMFKEQTNDLIDHLKEKDYDVLIVNSGILTSLIPQIKNDIPDLKIIAWQHNEFDIYVNHYNKNHITDYIGGVKQADLLVCLTKADQLSKKGSFIYNPLTIENNNEISKLTNNQIIFVGRLNLKQKGLDYLIPLGKSLKSDWTILIAGDGPDKSKLLELIKKNELEDKIILKGPLTGEKLFDFYLSGSIFISTSRWEGFGLVLTEAMAFGLPVVSFDNSGPKEILENGESGILIEKNNIKEFSLRLDELIEEPLKREYYQQKSLERVMDFNKEVIVDKWESKIKNVVSNK
jgi:glycosyltransferase involved in cell wall biosynthesis